MLELWKIEISGEQPILFPDMSSLDSVTRQLPAGLYSTFRTYAHRTRVLGLKSHLQRLYGPSRMLNIHPLLEKQALRRRMSALVSEFPSEEARIRLVLTIHSSPGNLYIAIEPLQLPSPEVYIEGVRVVTTPISRTSPELKSTSFIGQSMQQRRDLGLKSAYEALMVKNDHILEGLTSNFFYLRNEILGTARRGVLNGVTRRQVLRLAGELGMPVRFRALQLSDVQTIQEAFLTSSSRAIVPIVQIDGAVIGSGRVGEGTRRLMRAYDADIETRAEKIV